MSKARRKPKAPSRAKAASRSGGRGRWIGLLSAGATLALVIALAGAWALSAVFGPGPRTETGAERVVVLRKGAGLSEIASALERAGAIRSSALFVATAQATGAAGQLKAGEYAVPSGASLSAVLGKIRRGEVVRHFITIPEGRSSEQVHDILMASKVLEGEVPVPPEGSVLPETYEVQRGDDRAAVLKRMMDAHDRFLAQVWPRRAKDLPFTTQAEAVTLASIVEKETGLARERPQVAAVFVNRLRRGMRLESDPTIIYPITRGRPLGRAIRRSEIDASHPWNTYVISGLPPTPIANPGKASIMAVLNPPRSDYLFFVADGSGGHVFAATYAEHEANVAKWRKIRAAREAAVPAKAG